MASRSQIYFVADQKRNRRLDFTAPPLVNMLLEKARFTSQEWPSNQDTQEWIPTSYPEIFVLLFVD